MLNIKLAISTLSIYTHRDADLAGFIEENSDVEFWEIIDEGFHRLSDDVIPKLKEIASKSNISFSIHAPILSINLAESEPYLRDTYVRYLNKSISNALRISPEVYILHSGSLTSLTYFYPELAWNSLIKSLNHIARYAYKHGLNIAVENGSGRTDLFRNSDDGLRIVNSLNLDNVGLCLDIGHALISNSLTDIIYKLRDKIIHLHVHDNDGVKDTHNPLGSGKAPQNLLKDLFREFKGWITAENYNIEDSRKTLKHILDLLH
ncbi:MAG: sugar phosphate isomerase/epimerase [Candidatus Methanomethylicia archaeon]